MKKQNPATNNKEDKEVSGIIIGYKFALGIIEILLGLGVATLGDKALNIYQKLKEAEVLEGPHDLFVSIVDNLIPSILQHKVAIILILLFIGTVKIISCIAIWMGKSWGVHLLLFLMLVILPFDLYSLLGSLIRGHVGFGSMILNAINFWIILSLTHYHPVVYFRKVDWKNFF